MIWVTANRFNPTKLHFDLSTHEQTPDFHTVGWRTNIIVDQADVPGTATGIVFCDEAWSSLHCDQHFVPFESATPPKALICHEFGHAVGLVHGSDANPQQLDTWPELGCMTTPVVGDDLKDINVGNINENYP